MEAKVWCLTDVETGKQYTGTMYEIAEQIDIKITTLRTYVSAGKYDREQIGTKTVKRREKTRLTAYTLVKTGERFVGTQAQALEHFGLSKWQMQMATRSGKITWERLVNGKPNPNPKPKTRKAPQNKSVESRTSSPAFKRVLSRELLIRSFG
ncbi:hypothetical protein SAMN05216392_0794 [Streptococcus equinus]|uniref:Uncharacterized protein n=1 Tax=Streptococcus equinus TaxID=1335 RepID=A0A1H0YPR2_STREI|nr:hypothetical protein [Streptococcus equinus]SDQ17153.1 hypothetical protein SAMN05216392_0794 [Streptococcus equinus]